MQHSWKSDAASLLVGAIVTASFGGIAAAAGDSQAVRLPVLPAYQQECAACHVPYAPGLLPASSWQRLMGNLPRHFGTDASLDAATHQSVAAWILANAGTYKRVREEPPQDRITRSAWFIRKHDEVPAATWKVTAVKSPANCAACHPQAEKGNFNERDVRIPR